MSALRLALAPRVGAEPRFSVTVSSVNVPRPSGTCAIPARATASGPPRSGLPANVIRARAADGAGDRAQRRRLPGAVRAEHGDDRPLGHLERDAVERLDGPVARLDVVELEQSRHSWTPR